MKVIKNETSLSRRGENDREKPIGRGNLVRYSPHFLFFIFFKRANLNAKLRSSFQNKSERRHPINKQKFSVSGKVERSFVVFTKTYGETATALEIVKF